MNMLQTLRTWYLRVKYATQNGPHIYKKIQAALETSDTTVCPFCRHWGGVHNKRCYLPTVTRER